MPYKITDYSKRQARRLGVTIKPSSDRSKKIDVYKNGKKIASIGAKGYKDYPTYMALEKKGKVPKGTANQKRKNYKARHQNNRTKKGSNGYYADQILW